MLRKSLSFVVLAATTLLAWPVGEPCAAALKCSGPPRGIYVLELTELELLEGDASLEDEEARLDASTAFDASFVRMTEDDVLYFGGAGP